jgi:hypothetical protein
VSARHNKGKRVFFLKKKKKPGVKPGAEAGFLSTKEKGGDWGKTTTNQV